MKDVSFARRFGTWLAMICLTALAFKACGEAAETQRLGMRLELAEKIQSEAKAPAPALRWKGRPWNAPAPPGDPDQL